MIGWVFWSEGAANLIPRPRSTELAMFIGFLKRGWLGLMVAGCCFIIPAALLVSMIAAACVRFGALPQMVAVLYGIKPAVIAIILQALWSLGRTAAVRAKSVGAPLRSNQMSIMNGTVAKRGIENRQVAPFLPSSTLLHIIDGLSNPRAIMPANADH